MNSIEHMEKAKKNSHPPGGASSFVFGECPTEVVKPRNNHTASTVFDTDGNQENVDKRNVDINNNYSPNVPKEQISERIIAEKNHRKQAGFNPITGENYSPSSTVATGKEHSPQVNGRPKMGTPVNPPIVTSHRQPPGGKSSNLW